MLPPWHQLVLEILWHYRIKLLDHLRYDLVIELDRMWYETQRTAPASATHIEEAEGVNE
jgi:hypothetical protein